MFNVSMCLRGVMLALSLMLVACGPSDQVHQLNGEAQGTT